MTLVVERVSEATAEVRVLLRELDDELSANYSAEQRHGLAVARLFTPDVTFFVVRLGGEAIGCGGIAFYDGFAELKRMFVRKANRGQGAIQALLACLEAEAAVRSYQRITLETGDAQAAAIRAYKRAGYAPCAAFGTYLTLGAFAIERSVFLEKRIS